MKEEALDDLPRKDERGSSSIRPATLYCSVSYQTNIHTVSKATLGKLLRGGVGRIWAFPSA